MMGIYSNIERCEIDCRPGLEKRAPRLIFVLKHSGTHNGPKQYEAGIRERNSESERKENSSPTSAQLR